MSEIEVGEYVRTIWGMIRKVSVVKDTLIWCEEYYYNGRYSEGIVEFKDIKAHSKNILDIVEVGDYINGDIVNQITKNYISVGYITIGKRNIKNIKSILTHEQYEQNCYKVVE